MKLLIALLLFAFPLAAQTAPAWTTLGYEWYNTFDLPSGTFTLRLGCVGKWTGTKTTTGPISNATLDYTYFGLKTDVVGCPGSSVAFGRPSIQVLQNPSSFTVGIHTWNGHVYGPAVPKTIPAFTGTIPSPLPPQSITIPAVGTCAATINSSAATCSYTINPAGSLVITAGSISITVGP